MVDSCRGGTGNPSDLYNHDMRNRPESIREESVERLSRHHRQRNVGHSVFDSHMSQNDFLYALPPKD